MLLADYTIQGERLDAFKGTSGAPLFADSGVIGMVISAGGTYTMARRIDFLRNVAKNSGIAFQLGNYTWTSLAPQWYLGLGIGTGTNSMTYDAYDEFGEPTGERETVDFRGTMVNIRAGKGLKRNFLLGAELDYWLGEEEEDAGEFYTFKYSMMNLNLSGSLTYYISRALYIRGGLAASYARIETTLDPPEPDVEFETLEEIGLGVSGGLGYQVKLSEVFSLVPNVSIMYQELETMTTVIWGVNVGLIYFKI
jgi:hypothetical protein